MRHTREIQSVGCDVSSASDHTFQAIKKYMSALIFGALLAIHTIPVETGEIASAVIVSTAEARHFADTAEQFSRRPNVKPRMHVVDNYPAYSELFHILFGCTCILRLGLFHFIQRITRTLRIDHIDFLAAVKALSACLYREDPIDVENVKLALRDGRLGSRNKKGE